MEHIWSRAVATGGNQSQMRRRRQRPRYAKTVAVGCNRLPIGAHGKGALPPWYGGGHFAGSAKKRQVLRTQRLTGLDRATLTAPNPSVNNGRLIVMSEVDVSPSSKPTAHPCLGDEVAGPHPVHGVRTTEICLVRASGSHAKSFQQRSRGKLLSESDQDLNPSAAAHTSLPGIELLSLLRGIGTEA